MRFNARPPAFLLLAVALSASAFSQQNWISYTEDASRLSGAASLTGSDVEEKDMDVADFDQDGDSDLIVVRKTPPPYQVTGPRQHVLFMNVGGVLTDLTGVFAPQLLNDLTDARDVKAIDVDHDTWPDIVIVNTFDQEPGLYMNQGNDAQGAWQGFVKDTGRFPTMVSPLVGPMFCEVAFGDFTGDGFTDLYFIDYNNNLEDVFLANDGTGNFTNETSVRFTSAMVSSGFGTGCQAVDMNGDGWLDIVKSATGPRIIYNDGTGNFSQDQSVPTSAAYMFRCFDIDKDGDQDMYVVQDGQDRYIINNGTNPDGSINMTTTDLLQSPGTTGFGGNVTLGDLDRDGYTDVVVSDIDIDVAGCGRRLSLLRNMSGSGGWQRFADPFPAQMPWNPNGTHDTALLDIDGDGNLDIVAGTCSGTFVYLADPRLTLQFGQDAPSALVPLPDLLIRVRGGAPGTKHFTLISLIPVIPASGGFFGMGPDTFLNLLVNANVPPLDVTLDANGQYSANIPGPLPPITLQVRGLELPTVPGQPIRLSNVVTPTLL